MATQAQTTANRVNSQKSTGPRTAEGKAAVSQNAFKHGLFVDKAVVRDESQDEYDLRREAALAELQPVGEMESIVAERFVNLSWRLKRAERMQNQSIDYLGLDQIGGSYNAEAFQEKYRKANGLSHDDPAIASDHLLLGRIATRDWSNCRVLDKMMMYERRIESSMYKTLNELNKLQAARKAEQARVAERQSAQEIPPPRRHKGDLKKQSQFAPALVAQSLVQERIMMINPAAARLKTKPIKANFASTQAPLAEKAAARSVAGGKS